MYREHLLEAMNAKNFKEVLEKIRAEVSIDSFQRIIHSTDMQRMTLLHEAAKRGLLDIVRLLVEEIINGKQANQVYVKRKKPLVKKWMQQLVNA